MQLPIGIFDSGLGGLTVIPELIKALPNEDIVYLGDTARAPYGVRSTETIIRYTEQDIDFLRSKNAKIIISACGTASSVALPEIDSPAPIFGIVASLVDAVQSKKVGVIGTPATIKSGAFQKQLSEKGCEFLAKACPLFVPLVENGYSHSEPARIIAKDYLQDFEDYDELILGCTHYPHLAEIIQEVLPDTKLITTGEVLANKVKNYLEKNNMLNNKRSIGKHRFFVTDENNFKEQTKLFFGETLECEVIRL